MWGRTGWAMLKMRCSPSFAPVLLSVWSVAAALLTEIYSLVAPSVPHNFLAAPHSHNPGLAQVCHGSACRNWIQCSSQSLTCSCARSCCSAALLLPSPAPGACCCCWLLLAALAEAAAAVAAAAAACVCAAALSASACASSVSMWSLLSSL